VSSPVPKPIAAGLVLYVDSKWRGGSDKKCQNLLERYKKRSLVESTGDRPDTLSIVVSVYYINRVRRHCER